MGNSLNKYGTYTKIDTNKKNKIDKIINNIQKYKNKKYLFFNRYKKREDSNDDIYVIDKDTELKKIKQNKTIFSNLTDNDLETIENKERNQLVKCNLTGKQYRKKDGYIYILENKNSLKLDNKINILECLKKLGKEGIYYFQLDFANFKKGVYETDVEVKDIKLSDNRIYIEDKSNTDDFYKKFEKDIKKGSFYKRYTYSFLLKYVELLMNNKMGPTQFIELMKEYYIINKTYEIEYYTSWFKNPLEADYIKKFFNDIIYNESNNFKEIKIILCYYIVFIQQCNTGLTMILLDNKVKRFIDDNTGWYIHRINALKQIQINRIKALKQIQNTLEKHSETKIPDVLQDKKYLSYFQIGKTPNFLICPRGDKNLMIEEIESNEQKKNINNIITKSKNLNKDGKKCFRQYKLQNNSNMVKILDYDKEYTPFFNLTFNLTKYNKKEKIEILKSIMKCIAILHDQYNMYHRYLIPQNILIKKKSENGNNIYETQIINFKEAIKYDFIEKFYKDNKTEEEYFKFISSWILNKKIRYLFCGNFYLLLLEYMIYYWIKLSLFHRLSNKIMYK